MSTNFIINPYSISFEGIRDDLMNYAASKSDYDSWKDFFASGAGQTLIELSAALGAMYSYQFILGRREAYLSVAQNYSSVLGSANNLGYSASRGVNTKVRLTVLPNETLTLPKWSVIGTYQDYDIVLLEDIILNKDLVSTVDVIIGNFMQEVININTNNLTQFKFSNTGTTDTFRLLLNETEVPFSNNIKDALNDYYVGISNVYGSMDIFYLQTGNYQYKTSDKLILQFIERNNVTSEDLKLNSFTVDYAKEVKDYELLVERQDIETADSIKIKAPIFHESASMIRSRHDYSKYILTKFPILADANDHDIYPGLIEIAAIKQNGLYLNDNEELELLNAIEEARPSGVAKAIMTKPKEISKVLNITITKLNDEYVSLTINDYIDKIIEAYNNQLEMTLDLHQMEYAIDRVSGVKVSRVQFDQNKWQSETFYELYHIVEPSGENPKFSHFAKIFSYLSAPNEPIWPTEINDIVIDNRIVWKKVNESVATLGITEWAQNKNYELNQYVRGSNDLNSLYRCVGQINLSGALEPEWAKATEIDNILYDNEIIWKRVETEEEVQIWEANKNYNVGDYIHSTQAELSKYVYVCIGFRAKSGAIEPSWAEALDTITLDGRIKWQSGTLNNSSLTLDWNEFFNLSKELIIQ